MTGQDAQDTLHATCVAAGDRGLLILGASGSGKSGLALQLIALGARLVSDDRVAVKAEGAGALRAFCPLPPARGLIEARGFGLLHVQSQDSARLILAIDLDQEERDRLPHPRRLSLLGCTLPLAHATRAAHLPSALWCHLLGAARDLGE